MDSSDLQHALQLHFTSAMFALTRRQNSAHKLNDEIFQVNSQAQANNTVTRPGYIRAYLFTDTPSHPINTKVKAKLAKLF
jgi:hypothetical protein